MKSMGLFSLSLSLLLTACASLETLLKSAPVPSERMFVLAQKSDKDSAQLTIIRDRSFAGSICYYAIYIDNKLVSRIGSAERATFSLEPGERKIQVTRDKQGEGLCSSGDDETTEKVALVSGEKKYYRLSQNIAGSPNLEVLKMQPESEVR